MANHGTQNGQMAVRNRVYNEGQQIHWVGVGAPSGVVEVETAPWPTIIWGWVRFLFRTIGQPNADVNPVFSPQPQPNKWTGLQLIQNPPGMNKPSTGSDFYV